MDSHKDRQSDKCTDTKTESDRHTYNNRQMDSHKDRQLENYTDRQSDRCTDGQTYA